MCFNEARDIRRIFCNLLKVKYRYYRATALNSSLITSFVDYPFLLEEDPSPHPGFRKIKILKAKKRLYSRLATSALELALIYWCKIRNWICSGWYAGGHNIVSKSTESIKGTATLIHRSLICAWLQVITLKDTSKGAKRSSPYTPIIKPFSSRIMYSRCSQPIITRMVLITILIYLLTRDTRS